MPRALFTSDPKSGNSSSEPPAAQTLKKQNKEEQLNVLFSRLLVLWALLKLHAFPSDCRDKFYRLEGREKLALWCLVIHLA